MLTPVDKENYLFKNNVSITGRNTQCLVSTVSHFHRSIKIWITRIDQRLGFVYMVLEHSDHLISYHWDYSFLFSCGKWKNRLNMNTVWLNIISISCYHTGNVGLFAISVAIMVLALKLLGSSQVTISGGVSYSSVKRVCFVVKCSLRDCSCNLLIQSDNEILQPLFQKRWDAVWNK